MPGPVYSPKHEAKEEPPSGARNYLAPLGGSFLLLLLGLLKLQPERRLG
jgi:hypothetical protein